MTLKKRRWRRLKRWLKRRRGFLVMVLVLLGMGGAYRGLIAYSAYQSARLDSLQAQVSQAKLDESPQQYLGLTRRLEFVRTEPFFIALFAIIPVSLALVAIILFIKGKEPGIKHQSYDWVKETRRRALDFREHHRE